MQTTWLVIGLVVMPVPVLAQWIGGVSDNYMTQGNWTGNTVGGNINSLDPSDGPVLKDAAVTVQSSNVGNSAGTGKLTILSEAGEISSLTSQLQMVIGNLASGTGTVVIDGSGARLTAGNISSTADNTGLRVASNGVGTLTVANGGTLKTGKLEIAVTNGNGTVNIGNGGAAGFLDVLLIEFGNGGAWTQAQVTNNTPPTGGATLNFNHTDSAYILSADLRSRDPLGTHVIHSAASINHLGSGHTTLTGNVIDVRGNVDIDAGTLRFAGLQHYEIVGSTPTLVDGMKLTGNMSVANGATLGIGQRIARTTTHALNITGNLLLDSGAIVEMGIGVPGLDLNSTDGSLNDAIHVGGDLALNGTLNLYDIGNGSGGQGIGFGRYELFTYGTLVENTMTIGSIHNNLPGSLQNDGGNSRIVLVIEQALGDSAWWAGGDGTWNNDPDAESWSAVEDPGPGDTLFAWNEGQAIFNGAGGVVTVTDDVNFTEISFEANGYVIADGGGNVLGNPTDPEQNVVNLNAISGGITGEIATGLREGRDGLQMRKYGPGTIVLSSDNNHWTGGTNLEGGVLQIGSGVGGGTTGHLPGNVINGGILRFNRSNGYVYDGIISAGGQVQQSGTGTTILTGANTYTGLTTISAGTLQIGNASQNQNTGSIGTGAVSIGANGTLAFDRLGDLTFGNTITGAGTLAQRGGGELLLTGILTNFTGNLLAEHGSIRFGSGSNYTGTVTVGDGGVFSGTGRVGGITVQSGGTLSPGNSIGTLNVNGTLEFQNGSTFAIEVDDTVESLVAPIVQSADRVVVTGNVKLGGTVRVDADEARTILNVSGREWNQPINRYTILTYTGTRTHDGVDTAFETEVDTDLLFMTPTLDYGNGVVTLTLVRNDIHFAELAGLTPNQMAAATALQNLGYEHPATSVGVTLHDAALTLNADGAQAAFNAVSGEYHASVRNRLLDDSRLVRDATMARASHAAGRSVGNQVWVQALSHDGHAESGDTARFNRSTAGFLVGADHELGAADASFGWSAGYQRSTTDADTLLSEGNINSLHMAVYGGTRWAAPLAGVRDGSVGLRVGGAYSWHEIHSKRQVDFPGYAEAMTAKYDANTLQLFGEVDYRAALGDIELAPFLGLAWARLGTDAFIEGDFTTDVGGGTAVLRADADSHDTSIATLGLRGVVPAGPLSVRGMLGWRSVLSGDDLETRLGFLNGAPGERFSVTGAPMADNAFVADLGLDLALGAKARVGLAYAGQLSSDTQDHALHANLHIVLP